MPRIEGRPGASLPPLDFGKLREDLQQRHSNITDKDVMSAALYPAVTEDFLNFREEFGPVAKLDTKSFLVGPKKGEEIEVIFLLHTSFIFKKFPYHPPTERFCTFPALNKELSTGW